MLKRLNHTNLVAFWICAGLILGLATQGFSFPIRSFSNPYCKKWVHWTQLPETCKEELKKDWSFQDNSPLLDVQWLVYSAIRGASYNDPRTPESGSHPSLDIVSAEGTPVLSIWDWVVINARERAWFWNSVTVKHAFKDTYIYSNYSHLEDMFVAPWQVVKEWDTVGTVWRTGFTIGPFGYHLDFQITTAESPSHPYGLHDCDVSYVDAVNQRACRDKVERFTIDPQEFFDTYLPAQSPSVATKQSVSKVVLPAVSEPVLPAVSEPVVSSINAQTIRQYLQEQKNKRVAQEQEEVISPTPVLQQVAEALPEVFVPMPTSPVDILTTPTRPEEQVHSAPAVVPVVLPQNVLPVDISRSVFGDEHKAWSYIPVTFTVTDTAWNPLQSTLNHKIRLETTSRSLKMFPSSFSRVVNWTKTLVMLPQQEWLYGVSVYYWDVNVWAFDVQVK